MFNTTKKYKMMIQMSVKILQSVVFPAAVAYRINLNVSDT